MESSGFDDLEKRLRSDGAEAAFDHLVEQMKDENRLRDVFQVLLMKKRHQLGLAVHGDLDLEALTDSVRPEIEQNYVNACRTVGALHLDRGEITEAWSYFHVIRDPATVARALESWSPSAEEPSEEVEKAIQIAFGQGVHPVRGYELILTYQGTCEGITTLERGFPYAPALRETCVRRLLDHFYDEIRSGVRLDLKKQENDAPADADLLTLIANRSWLFENQRCHADDSHLQAIVRFSPVLRDPEGLGKAIELCEYGKRLGEGYRPAEPPPFEDFYEDYRLFLGGLAGREVESSVEHFRSKAARKEASQFSVEVLVFLLQRTGRYDEAGSVSRERLEKISRPLSIGPPLTRIYEEAGDFRSLSAISREGDDPLQFLLALIGQGSDSRGG